MLYLSPSRVIEIHLQRKSVEFPDSSESGRRGNDFAVGTLINVNKLTVTRQ